MGFIKRQIEQVVRDMVPYFKVITITGHVSRERQLDEVKVVVNLINQRN